MLSSPILSSSLLLLQYLTVSVWGTPTPQADDFGDRFPTIPDDPTPPPRPCDAAGCRDPTYQLPPSFFPGQDIFVILFGRPGRYQSTSKPDINQILKGYLQDSLPYFLKQLAPVPSKIPDLVKEGIPLLVNAILSTLGANDMKDVPKLQAWAKKVYPKASCDLFAAAALPAYLAGFDTVYFANNPKQVLDYGAKPSIPELDYFIQPAYGPISHNDGVTIFYNAKFPAFFGQRHVVSEGRDVFVRSPAVSHSQASLSNPEFNALVRHLLYQFGHVKKWSEVDYLDSDYEMQYLKGLCEVSVHVGVLERLR